MQELIIGESFAIRQVRALIRTLAPTNLPVLVQGPTGTGKELVAQALHSRCDRAGALVCFNVCAIADTMFEDALFGHVRGAFTGACSDASGYLAEANGGTLFLDEISRLPLPLQAKLLRVIETGEYRPVGGRANRRSCFRLVSASNESLGDLIGEGVFRSDLYFRLRGAVVNVPALRDRIEDVRLLADHFVRTTSESRRVAYQMTSGAYGRLERHGWPGNVRELRHVVELACTIAVAGRVEVEHTDAALSAGAPQSVRERPDGQRNAADALKELLEANDWDTARVAASLGVSRKTVYERIRRLGIASPRRQRHSGENCDGSVDPFLVSTRAVRLRSEPLDSPQRRSAGES
ncbi:MAG TPA: sigma 54-interacting transcriptional regulator [Gemmatimonadaceae bacterium]|nr:sigma 54-interacting transcriptional regulator [Gemmatimonadaceae bacterium]